MTRWAVTLVCVAGVALAAWISYRCGGRPLSRPRRDPDEVVGAWPGASRALRIATVAVLSGAITTALVLGLGGRLMMRIAAATSSELVQGNLTDAEEPIGAVTVGGTVEFVLFFTLFVGGAIGIAYVLLRRYLPGPAWFAGLVVSVIAAGIAGPADFTDPDNVDFRILEPTWLIALMIVALIVLFGTTLGATYEWLNERVPRLNRTPRSVAWYLPLLPLSLMPTTLAAVAIAAMGGAVVPANARDAMANPRLVRLMGTLAAVASTYFAVTLAIDLASIAF